MVYESSSGQEEIVSSETHDLEKIESQLESFRQRCLPLATSKLLEEGQSCYVKKSSKN